MKEANNNMKRTHALLVLLAFAIVTLWTTVRDYQVSQRQITDDLTQALTLTASEQPADWLSTDTIRQYRDHLLLPQLQDKAMLMFCLVDDERHNQPNGLSGRGISVLPGVQAYGQVSLSALDVWRMGDHRLSLVLSLLTLFWMLLSLSLTRRKVTALTIEGCLVNVNGRYHDAQGLPLHLTPMQSQLIEMFLASPSHELTKDEICSALWPRKDDPSDTLYALISRLKAVLEPRTPLRITSERGRSYRLLFSSPTS